MVPYNKPSFSSGYASRLYEFVESKRLEGYKYNGEVKELQRLDRYFQTHGVTPADHPEETVYRWLSKRSSESDKTFSTRNSVYRQFYSYLLSQGDDVLPSPPNAREKLHGSGFTPYIFTHDEIRRIFDAADNWQDQSTSYVRCAPLLFRLLYGTGLRISEALSLTVGDISLSQKVLLVREAKNDNSRLVPMSPSLSKRMADYLSSQGYSDEEPVFQHNEQMPFLRNTAYDWFRNTLWKAGIHHKGRGKGPRLHDIRHTFAVHSLQAAVEAGTDPNAFLPLLCTYLGHRNLSATERYLRLTAEAYPFVVKTMDGIMEKIIPEVERYER